MNNRYGRKIGFARLVLASVYDYLGFYSRYRNIDWRRARRLVFICHGNICRSAYGEARARQQLLETASAGLGAIQDGPADAYAVKKAAQRSVNLDLHRTTPVPDLETRKGDVFICMEPSQAHAMELQAGNTPDQQVTLLGLWSDRRRPYLQDPYGLSDEYWDTCLDIIDSAIENIARKLPANR